MGNALQTLLCLQNKGSGDRRRPLKGGSQSAPTSSSSLIAERVKNAKWRVGQRSEGQIEVGSVLDNSGTCVDSEDESRDDFVDGVEFMRRLSEQQMENQHDQREVAHVHTLTSCLLHQYVQYEIIPVLIIGSILIS